MTSSEIYETRRKNLMRLIEKHGTQAALSEQLGLKSTGSYISMLAMRRKEISEKTARRWEQLLRLPRMWMDTDHDVTQDFDFIVEAPMGMNDPSTYVWVVEQSNRYLRERKLEVSIDVFKKLVDAACEEVVKCNRPPDESVKHVMNIASLLVV